MATKLAVCVKILNSSIKISVIHLVIKDLTLYIPKIVQSTIFIKILLPEIESKNQFIQRKVTQFVISIECFIKFKCTPITKCTRGFYIRLL